MFFCILVIFAYDLVLKENIRFRISSFQYSDSDDVFHFVERLLIDI